MLSKLLTATLFCCFISLTTNAQLEKGMRMVGASVGSVFFNAANADYVYNAGAYTATGKNTAYGLSFTPSYGWFFTDKLVAGAQLSVNYKSDKRTDESNGNTFYKNEVNTFTFGAGVFARNYFSTSGSFLPFAQLNLEAGTGSAKTEGFLYTNTYKDTRNDKSSGDFSLAAGLSLGMTKMLGKNTGLDIYAGYRFMHYKTDFTSETLRDVGFNGSVDETIKNSYTQKYNSHGFNIGIGFQVFLDKKK